MGPVRVQEVAGQAKIVTSVFFRRVQGGASSRSARSTRGGVAVIDLAQGEPTRNRIAMRLDRKTKLATTNIDRNNEQLRHFPDRIAPSYFRTHHHSTPSRRGLSLSPRKVCKLDLVRGMSLPRWPQRQATATAAAAARCMNTCTGRLLRHTKKKKGFLDGVRGGTIPWQERRSVTTAGSGGHRGKCQRRPEKNRLRWRAQHQRR